MLVFFAAQLLLFGACLGSREYELPVLPVIFPSPDIPANYTKLIPQKIWVAVKDAKDELPGTVICPISSFTLLNAFLLQNRPLEKLFPTEQSLATQCL